MAAPFKLEVRPNLRPYEAVILVHPDTNEEDQKTLFRKNKAIIEEQFGGSVKNLDTWGKRSLANPIAKMKKAIYFHSTFSANPQAIAELERTMRINDKVLRFMHTRLDERQDLDTHLENFRKALAESATREREREAKFQARKAAMGSRGPRRDDGEGGGRGDRGGFRRDDRGPRGGGEEAGFGRGEDGGGEDEI
ncbi:MAG TPA: 30S ribosomal protein S6 [Bdellovibrionales bacterium]|nr:30S ribosomal protein S6 [Bdellovibrionales bacterium]